MRKKLLLFYIDDEPDLCEIFKETLEGQPFDIFTFTDPEEALKAAQELRPDIAIVDYRLPKLTGDKVAAQLPSPVRTILLTGELNIQSSFPFDRILFKPINFESLIPILKELSLSPLTGRGAR